MGWRHAKDRVPAPDQRAGRRESRSRQKQRHPQAGRLLGGRLSTTLKSNLHATQVTAPVFNVLRMTARSPVSCPRCARDALDDAAAPVPLCHFILQLLPRVTLTEAVCRSTILECACFPRQLFIRVCSLEWIIPCRCAQHPGDRPATAYLRAAV